MSLFIIAILLVLGVLIVAGPVLEDLIDRIWPSGDDRRRRRPAHHR